jgi:hypothetical protein
MVLDFPGGKEGEGASWQCDDNVTFQVLPFFLSAPYMDVTTIKSISHHPAYMTQYKAEDPQQNKKCPPPFFSFEVLGIGPLELTTWAMPSAPVVFILFFEIGSNFAQLSSKSWSSCLHLPSSQDYKAHRNLFLTEHKELLHWLWTFLTP